MESSECLVVVFAVVVIVVVIGQVVGAEEVETAVAEDELFRRLDIVCLKSIHDESSPTRQRLRAIIRPLIPGSQISLQKMSSGLQWPERLLGFE